MSMNDEKQSKNTVSAGGSVGFCGLLTLVFIVLKLIGVINWSWFWVISPIIFGTAFWVLILLGCIVVIIVGGILAKILDR